MLTHSAIWDALDALARRHGHSVSGLARLAGLDPTAFNKSKRVSKDGRERWPSTESIAKVLDATGESFEGFLAGFAYQQPAERAAVVPVLGLAEAADGDYFDASGLPAGPGWDAMPLPVTADGSTYALEVQDDTMLPLYRQRDILIVSRTEQIRRGDRVIVKLASGPLLAKILHRQTPKQLELHSINPVGRPTTVNAGDVEWLARILWASQ